MKLSERLFNIGKEFETNAGLEDVSTAALEAADLLDECERALTLYYNLCENHEIDDLIPENAVRILDKLRSQEIANE